MKKRLSLTDRCVFILTAVYLLLIVVTAHDHEQERRQYETTILNLQQQIEYHTEIEKELINGDMTIDDLQNLSRNY